MICSASSGNCVIDGKVDDGDVHMNAGKLLDSSTSCSGNEESSTEEKDTDSFKLYGCGICCQSFSTKEETINNTLLSESLTGLALKVHSIPIYLLWCISNCCMPFRGTYICKQGFIGIFQYIYNLWELSAWLFRRGTTLVNSNNGFILFYRNQHL